MAAPEMLTLVYDIDLRRPACVLLQAAADCPYHISHWWDSDLWLTSPTPGMRRITGTVEQWRELARRDNARHSSARSEPHGAS